MDVALVTLSDIAEHLGLSRTTIRDLEIEGVINRAMGLDDCRLAYIRHLRTRRSSAADDRLRLARAKAIEQRTRREAHELAPIAETLAVIDAAIGSLMFHLSSVPARCTRDITMRKVIETEVNRARSATADECERQAQSLTSTGKAAPQKWP